MSAYSVGGQNLLFLSNAQWFNEKQSNVTDNCISLAIFIRLTLRWRWWRNAKSIWLCSAEERCLFFFFSYSLYHSALVCPIHGRLFRIQYSKNNAIIFIFIHQNSLIFHGISFAHTCITVLRIRRKLRDFPLPLPHYFLCPPAVSCRNSNSPSNFIKTHSQRSHLARIINILVRATARRY